MKKNLLIGGLLGLIIGLTAFVRAETYKGKTEIGLRAGGFFTEGNSNIDEDWVYGGQVGYNVTDHWGIEAALLAGKTQFRIQSAHGHEAINSNNPSANIDVLLPSLDVLYNFGQSRFRPFVTAGVGDLHTKASSNVHAYGGSSAKNDTFIVQYGAGLKWLFSPSFLARLEAEHVINTEHSYQAFGASKNDAVVTAGISYLFGAERVAKPIVAAAAKVIDSDGDGVPDDKDACPGTPAGTKVDARGCPVVVDSDADGVPDDKDACPGTPAGTKVDARGCPVVIDSDGDGVPDDKDECPGTPAGTKVDSTGCPQTVKAIEDKWVLKGVNFETGSDKIKGDSVAVLDEAAEILKARTKVRVEIQGHTDSVGKPEANLALSEKRAGAVKDYLVKKGVNPSQLETKGYGENQPVGDNKTAEGRSQNRRIEFKVLSR